MKMQRKRHRIQHLLSVIICFVMLSCLAVGSSYSAMAETTNEAVTRVNNSLMQVRMVYDLNGSVIPIQGGTGFLINSNTILTCAHVVDVDTLSLAHCRVAASGTDSRALLCSEIPVKHRDNYNRENHTDNYRMCQIT